MCRIERVKERIDECKDRSTEITQSEIQREEE
jgi:hypothetical protein